MVFRLFSIENKIKLFQYVWLEYMFPNYNKIMILGRNFIYLTSTNDQSHKQWGKVDFERNMYFSVQCDASVIFISKPDHHSCSSFPGFSHSILSPYSATNTPLWSSLLAKIGIYTGDKLRSLFSEQRSNLVSLNDTLWWLYSAFFHMDYFYYAQLHWQEIPNTVSRFLINVLTNEKYGHALNICFLMNP